MVFSTALLPVVVGIISVAAAAAVVVGKVAASPASPSIASSNPAGSSSNRIESAAAAAPRPHIISIFQDDLGHYDSGIHNPTAAAWTRNITDLAREGIVLE